MRPADQTGGAGHERALITCPECKGLGVISTFFGGGRFESSRDCERCHGSGEVGACVLCDGAGVLGDAECPDCRGAGTPF